MPFAVAVLRADRVAARRSPARAARRAREAAACAARRARAAAGEHDCHGRDRDGGEQRVRPAARRRRRRSSRRRCSRRARSASMSIGRSGRCCRSGAHRPRRIPAAPAARDRLNKTQSRYAARLGAHCRRTHRDRIAALAAVAAARAVPSPHAGARGRRRCARRRPAGRASRSSPPRTSGAASRPARRRPRERARASSSIPATDPHSYQPTAADARALAGANMVIVNGARLRRLGAAAAAREPGRRAHRARRRQALRPAGGRQPAPLVLPARRARRDRARSSPAYERLDPADAAYFAPREHGFETRGLARYDALRARDPRALRAVSRSATARASSRASAKTSGCAW